MIVGNGSMFFSDINDIAKIFEFYTGIRSTWKLRACRGVVRTGNRRLIKVITIQWPISQLSAAAQYAVFVIQSTNCITYTAYHGNLQSLTTTASVTRPEEITIESRKTGAVATGQMSRFILFCADGRIHLKETTLDNGVRVLCRLIVNLWSSCTSF